MKLLLLLLLLNLELRNSVPHTPTFDSGGTQRRAFPCLEQKYENSSFPHSFYCRRCVYILLSKKNLFCLKYRK